MISLSTDPSLRGRLLLALAAFLIGLAAFAPASLLEPLIQPQLGNRGSFHASEGTLWSGAGTLTLAGWGDVPLRWRFDFGALMRLRLGLSINAEADFLRGEARVSRRFGPIEVRDAALTADLSRLPLPVRASGSLALTAAGDQRLAIYTGEAQPLRGSFDLKMEKLTVPLWYPETLGNYGIAVSGDEQAIDFSVRESAGLLRLEGAGKLRALPSHELSFAGTAVPSRPGTALAPALAVLGKPGKDGRVDINYRGAW